MKRILLVLFIIVCSKHTYSQWTPVDTIQVEWDCNPSPLYYSFKYLSPDDAFWYWQRGFCSPANPDYFTIMKTNDFFSSEQGFYGCGGSVGNSGILYNFYPISPDTIYITYVCGSAFYFFIKTTDGGNSWTTLANNYIPKLTFVNGHLGYALDGNSFYRFYNDSLYFVSNINNFTINNFQMYFADSLRGYILSGTLPYTADTIIRTTDGGLSWSQIIIDPARTFYSDMIILNDSINYIYADSGYIYKTKDFGNTWSIALQNSSMGYIHFLNEKRLYSVNKDLANNLYYNFSNDSGLTWNSNNLQIGPIQSANIKMFDDSTGYINARKQIGFPFYEIILKTSNIGMVSNDNTVSSLNDALIIFPNPSNTSYSVTVPYNFLHEKNLTFSIYDNTGKLIQQKKLEMNDGKIKLNLDAEAKGVYNVMLSNGKKNITGRLCLSK